MSSRVSVRKITTRATSNVAYEIISFVFADIFLPSKLHIANLFVIVSFSDVLDRKSLYHRLGQKPGCELVYLFVIRNDISFIISSPVLTLTVLICHLVIWLL